MTTDRDLRNEVDRTLAWLADAVARRAALEAEIDGLVAVLRSPDLDGWTLATWQQVADALGVTRQAAQQAYSHLSWATVHDGPERPRVKARKGAR